MAQSPPLPALDVEGAVRARYADAARAQDAALCCPVAFDPRYLEAIPREVIERDYGCGDPSRYVQPGDVVLDLGSGAGKVCFIASQIAGPEGRVIGVDANDAMLALARAAAPRVAETLGYANVRFQRSRIQDLALDLDAVETRLRERPVRSAEDLAEFESFCERLRRETPLVANASVDLVVSNCVLNLVRESDKPRLVSEIFRVTRPGGRIAISDIVSDEPVPDDLKADSELWTGCVAGAFQEGELLDALERAGFAGLRVTRYADVPFRVIRGIEFRALTVTGVKPTPGPCLEGRHAVLYRGPWRQVEDDDGHVLRRGVRTAVCEKTFRQLAAAPYAEHLVALPPRTPVPEAERTPFDCARTAPRHPRETKGRDYVETTEPKPDACGPGGCC